MINRLLVGTGIETETGCALVALPAGDFYYLKGDEYVHLVYLSDSSTHVTIRAEKVNKIYRKKDLPPEILYWARSDNPELRLSNEEYSSMIYKFFNHELCENEYPSLEAEFEHRKNLEILAEKFYPVYEKRKSEFTHYPINILGKICETGSEFIHSSLCVGQLVWFDTRFMFLLESGEVAKDEVLNFAKNFSKFNIEIPNYSNILRVNNKGKYLFYDFDGVNRDWISNPKATNLFDSLEDAQLKERQIRSFVRKILEGEFRPISSERIKETDLILSLETIRKKASKIKCPKNSPKETAQHEIYDDVTSLIEKLMGVD